MASRTPDDVAKRHAAQVAVTRLRALEASLTARLLTHAANGVAAAGLHDSRAELHALKWAIREASVANGLATETTTTATG